MMPSRKVKIQNPRGLHLRPAGALVLEATRFRSEVFVSKNGLEVNAKSILGVTMLSAEVGSEIEIRAEGEDAEEAVVALAALIESSFGGIQ